MQLLKKTILQSCILRKECLPPWQVEILSSMDVTIYLQIFGFRVMQLLIHALTLTAV